MTLSQIRAKWKSFLRQLDINLGATVYRNEITKSRIPAGLHLHSLRHTAITRLVLAGADIKDVQNFAGHSDVETTLNIYTHINKNQSAQRLYSLQFEHANSGT